MTLTEVSAYRREGFAILHNYLPKSEVQKVFNDAQLVFQRQLVRHGLNEDQSPQSIETGMFKLFERHPQDYFNCGKQVQHLISLHRLSLDNKIELMLRDLGMGFPNISTRPVLFFNHKNLAKQEVYWKVSAHQDWRSMQGSLNAAIVWLPLVDVDVALGALQVVPGSHRVGLITNRVEECFGLVERYQDADFKSIEMRQGDALVFSAFLVHRSGENVTNAIRWSCHFRYNDLADPTFINRGFPHPYIYKPQEELITPNFPTQEAVLSIFV